MDQTGSVTPTELRHLSTLRQLCETGEAKRVRVDAGLGLSEVAATAGVAPQTVYRWEQKQRVPTGPAALRYASLLRALSRESAR